MLKMTEAQIREYLRTRGCPEFVWQGGGQGLIKRWNEFVAEVEKGYCPECCMEEY